MSYFSSVSKVLRTLVIFPHLLTMINVYSNQIPYNLATSTISDHQVNHMSLKTRQYINAKCLLHPEYQDVGFTHSFS